MDIGKIAIELLEFIFTLTKIEHLKKDLPYKNFDLIIKTYNIIIALAALKETLKKSESDYYNLTEIEILNLYDECLNKTATLIELQKELKNDRDIYKE